MLIEVERLGKPSFATGCVETPPQVKSYQQWFEENPNDERRTRIKFPEPEKRVDKDRYLSLDQSRETNRHGRQKVRGKGMIEKNDD